MATAPQTGDRAQSQPATSGPRGESDAPGPTCVVVHGGSAATYPGKQALEVFEGISAQSAGAQALCLHLVTIPPGGHARPHVHQDHETAVYVLSGAVEHRFGEGLRERLILRAGDFLYIPAGMPHSPANLSQTEPASAIVARTDPKEQESVVLRPDLEAVA